MHLSGDLSGFLALISVFGLLLVWVQQRAAGPGQGQPPSPRSRKKRRVIGVIPARYKSSRFPGKALVPILGKPMIVRTWEQACKATSLHSVIVATDDPRIAEVCTAAGAEVVMTRDTCPNGTVRCSEAVDKLQRQYDIVVNIQGDEPLMEPSVIDETVQALLDAPNISYSTACTPLAHEEVLLPHRVKVVLDSEGNALYFSRGLLPGNQQGKPQRYPDPYGKISYLLHLGIACFDRKFLRQYCAMPPTPLMLMEDLEQLKVLENGHKIRCIIVQHRAHGVDVPGDVADVEQTMREQGLA